MVTVRTVVITTTVVLLWAFGENIVLWLCWLVYVPSLMFEWIEDTYCSCYYSTRDMSVKTPKNVSMHDMLLTQTSFWCPTTEIIFCNVTFPSPVLAPSPSNRRRLSCGDYLEDKREDCQNCSHSHEHSQMNSFTGILWPVGIHLVRVFCAFVCFLLWGQFVCFVVLFLCFISAYFLVFVLSFVVSTSVIAWKDSSLKWPVASSGT